MSLTSDSYEEDFETWKLGEDCLLPISLIRLPPDVLALQLPEFPAAILKVAIPTYLEEASVPKAEVHVIQLLK